MSSTGVPPLAPTRKSWAVRSPWPPLPREYAIQLPSEECMGNRLDLPAAGTITVGAPQVLLDHGMVAMPAPAGASPLAVANTSCELSGDQSGCVAASPPRAR